MASRKVFESPVLRSSFDKTTFLPPQLDLTSVPEDETKQFEEGELDRYQVFVNEANAFSHVVSMVIALKGLEEVVYINAVRHVDGRHREDQGCAECFMQVTKMKIRDFAETMKNLFEEDTFPVPLLYDTKRHCIVSTDSGYILAFLNSQFNEWADNPELDLCPQGKKKAKKLKKLETSVLGKINRCIGVAGRASSMEGFQTAANELHEGLAAMELILQKNRYLTGSSITEADLMEFVALFRYDPLLSWVMTRNGKRVLIQESFPSIWGWLKDIFQEPGVSDTCDLIEIMNSKGFLQSFGTRIVELGIELPEDWDFDFMKAISELPGRDNVGSSSSGEKRKDAPTSEGQETSKSHKI